LAQWRPSTTTGDLGLQILDWWAYLADILTFYNQRAANQAYLGTADLPESPGRLVSVLGYRPRPGIGAVVTLAALAVRAAPLALPAGFQVSSKATTTVPSQIFELGTAVNFAMPTSVPTPPPDNLNQTATAGGPPNGSPPGAAEVPGHPQLIANGGVLVAKTPPKVSVGDRLLLASTGFSSGTNTTAAVVTVSALVPEPDPHGGTNTRVQLAEVASGALSGIPYGASAANFRLMRPTRSDYLATLPSGATVMPSDSSGNPTGLVLAATARALQPGDPLLLEVPTAGSGASYSNASANAYAVYRLTNYAEVIWYANASASEPTTPPSSNPVPLVLASLTISAPAGATWWTTPVTSQAVLRSGWVDVGVLMETPVSVCSALPGTVTMARAPAAPAGKATPALVVGADGNGTAVSATPNGGTTQVALGTPAGSGSGSGSGSSGGSGSGSAAPAALVPPLQLLWDLITLTRGQSVKGEALGTGDATQPGQDFMLSQAPVTYLSDPASLSGNDYSSTVTLWVDGVAWQEVQSFFGVAPGQQAFVTREDDSGKTHVMTGDGVTGARLRSGAVVTADYRVGGGAAVPPPGALTTVLSPVPNLSGVANPVAPYGGADPDQPSQVTSLAPDSVLTFGRAVSGDDYAVVAAQAPGVTQADAVWSWDPFQQRPTVTVYVNGGSGAVASAQAALLAEMDPNRPLVVVPAVPRLCSLRFGLLIASDYSAPSVVAAVQTALVDPVKGLFAPGALELGGTLYRSLIEATVLEVPGALAVQRLRMRVRRPLHRPLSSSGPRFNPGPGGWFDLPAGNLHITPLAPAAGGQAGGQAA
jgi:hypothetical protein